MSSTVRFTEVETGIEVSVSTPFTWGSDVPRVHVVTYPSGRSYAITSDQLSQHFTIITPQNIDVRAFGIDDRPTAKQRAAEALALANTIPPAPPLAAPTE